MSLHFHPQNPCHHQVNVLKTLLSLLLKLSGSHKALKMERDTSENMAVFKTSFLFHWLLGTPLCPATTYDSGLSGLLASPHIKGQ